MNERRGNEWLDDNHSSDDAHEEGYDSDAAELSRSSRPSKRRRLSHNRDGRSSSAASNGSGVESDEDLEETPQITNKEEDQTSESALKSTATKRKPTLQLASPLHPLPSDASKTGVVYISRIPPYMKPSAVRHHLSAFGNIGRIFLTPEDPAIHTRRVRGGGNKKRSFVDGWVEFARKKDAKLAVETLNARIVGGKKGSWYHDDVWNLKYLKGFKWSHLTEQIANENAERASRLRTEISQTTRENKRFIENVERAKMIEGIKAKRKEGAGEENEDETRERSRIFRQRPVAPKPIHKDPHDQPDQVKRVLGKIF